MGCAAVVGHHAVVSNFCKLTMLFSQSGTMGRLPLLKSAAGVGCCTRKAVAATETAVQKRCCSLLLLVVQIGFTLQPSL
jgi:hypothetical protein